MARGLARVANILQGINQHQKSPPLPVNALGSLPPQVLQSHRLVQDHMGRHMSGPEGDLEYLAESPTRSPNTATSFLTLLDPQWQIHRARELHFDASANATLSIKEWY